MSARSMKLTRNDIIQALGGKPPVEMEPCRECNGTRLWRSKRTPSIVTCNTLPPIADRQFDWIAHYDGEEEAGGYGYGATEAEAIADFNENYREDHDRRLGLIDGCPECEGTGEREVQFDEDAPPHAHEQKVAGADFAYRLGRE